MNEWIVKSGEKVLLFNKTHSQFIITDRGSEPTEIIINQGGENRVTFLNIPTRLSILSRWECVFNTPGSFTRSSHQPLVYGVPVTIQSPDMQQCLILVDTTPVVVPFPIQIEDLEQWLLLPTFDIHVCINPNTNQCHALSGPKTSQSMMHCYGTDSQVKCYDDDGHRVYRHAQECAQVCRVPSWHCTGAPLYQCRQTLDPSVKKLYPTYTDCIAGCANPHISGLRIAAKINNTQSRHIASSRVLESMGIAALAGIALVLFVFAIRSLTKYRVV